MQGLSLDIRQQSESALEHGQILRGSIGLRGQSRSQSSLIRNGLANCLVRIQDVTASQDLEQPGAQISSLREGREISPSCSKGLFRKVIGLGLVADQQDRVGSPRAPARH
jgi:hypothetical protein